MENRKKRVLVISPYPKDMAPSQRLKYEQYFEYLNLHGFEFEVRPFVSVKFSKIVNQKGKVLQKFYFLMIAYLGRFLDLFKIRNYDIIYIHLWVTPIGFPLFEYLYCKLARKVVYDIDDLIFLKDTKNSTNKIVNFVKGRKKPIYLMKHAQHVITCTPFLDSFVQKYNSNTTDISSTVDMHKLSPKSNYKLNNNQVVIGWSGSHSTSKYVLLLRKVFMTLNNLGLNYKLLVIGDENFNMPEVNFEAIPWSKENEADVIRQFDIGVYPLPDTQWVLGKSSLKAIQYMSVGVPTVATAIGTNFRVIENGVNGFLVTTDQEWVDTIVRLSKDENLRSSIGENAINKVEKEFSVIANRDKYLNILNNVYKI